MAFALPAFDKAEKEIQFLKPSQIQSLPQSIKLTLEAENCMIPVVPGSKNSSGWTKGSFANKNQTDWAVLCSNKSGESKIRVIWGGANKPCSDSLNLEPNKRYLQRRDESNIIFSRSISSIRSNEMTKYLKQKTFIKDGIVDAFLDKGSTIHFCTAGKWQSEVGGD